MSDNNSHERPWKLGLSTCWCNCRVSRRQTRVVFDTTKTLQAKGELKRTLSLWPLSEKLILKNRSFIIVLPPKCFMVTSWKRCTVALSNPGHFTDRVFPSRKKNNHSTRGLWRPAKDAGLELSRKALSGFQQLCTVVLACTRCRLSTNYVFQPRCSHFPVWISSADACLLRGQNLYAGEPLKGVLLPPVKRSQAEMM